MKNLTPQHLRCAPLHCPSVHELEDGDLTPEHMKCAIGATCPAIHAKAGQLVIIGKRGDGIIDDKVGPDEYAIVIDRELLAGVCATPARADGDGGESVHDELLRISDELSGRELYGAAQAMVRGARAIYALKAEVERLRNAVIDERRELMNMLGYELNGDGLTSDQDHMGDTVTVCHDPYYELEGALIDLKRQGADPVCIRTIERVQALLATIAKRARAALPQQEGSA